MAKNKSDENIYVLEQDYQHDGSQIRLVTTDHTKIPDAMNLHRDKWGDFYIEVWRDGVMLYAESDYYDLVLWLNEE